MLLLQPLTETHRSSLICRVCCSRMTTALYLYSAAWHCLHKRSHEPVQVDKPEQYGFHPDRLLLRMSELLLRLAEGAPFVAAVAEEPEYDARILRSVRARLLQKQLGEYGVAARLDVLMQQVRHQALVGCPYFLAAGRMRCCAREHMGLCCVFFRETRCAHCMCLLIAL